MNKKQKILEFLRSQLHMVISTVTTESTPEAAFVGFCEADDLTLVFGTYSTSRKYKNIEKNPRIAAVFGDERGITVQYEGVATVCEGEELVQYKKLYFAKNPGSKRFEQHPDQVYLKITPSWARYTNFTGAQEEIFEVNF